MNFAHIHVGSNAKMVHIADLTHPTTPANVKGGSKELSIIHTYPNHHLGSVYCVAWSPPQGQSLEILASGSNDKQIKLVPAPVKQPTSSWSSAVLCGHTGFFALVLSTGSPFFYLFRTTCFLIRFYQSSWGLCPLPAARYC